MYLPDLLGTNHNDKTKDKGTNTTATENAIKRG